MVRASSEWFFALPDIGDLGTPPQLLCVHSDVYSSLPSTHTETSTQPHKQGNTAKTKTQMRMIHKVPLRRGGQREEVGGRRGEGCHPCSVYPLDVESCVRVCTPGCRRLTDA